MLDNEAFYFFESDRNISTGLGFGASSNHKSIKHLLSYYDNRYFIINGKIDLTPCPDNNSRMLKTCYPQFKRNGKFQLIDDCSVYSNNEYQKIMKHYGTATWIDGEKKNIYFKDTKLKKFLRNPEKFDYIEKKFGEESKFLRVYTFIVYDLMENGIFYYIKRILMKLRK